MFEKMDETTASKYWWVTITTWQNWIFHNKCWS